MRRDNDQYIGLKIISGHREEIFGLATLWLVLFHSVNIRFRGVTVFPGIIEEFLEWLKASGNIGVDFFLILSGVGLYYSFSSCSGVIDFYCRRIKRIVPTVLLCSALWFGMRNLRGLGFYLGHVFLGGLFLTGETYFWYFTLLVLLYLVFPLLYRIQQGAHAVLYTVLLILGWILVTLLISQSELYGQLEIAITRVPAFLIGTCIGKKVYENKRISKRWIIIGGLASILSFFVYNLLRGWSMIYRYIGTSFALFAILSVSYLCETVDAPRVKSFLRGIGTYSMEIYLLYSGIALVCSSVFLVTSDTGIAYYIPVFVLTLIFAVLLKKVAQILSDTLFSSR